MLSYNELRKNVIKLLPTSILHGGKRITQRTRLTPVYINMEFIQWNTCAGSRLVNYLVSGTIPPHLVRNCLLK